MNDNIVGVLLGGGIGLLSTLITLIVTGYNDRTRRRLKYKEQQVQRLARTTLVLYEVENLLLQRLVEVGDGAKPTLKIKFRNEAGGDGVSATMIPKNELNRVLEFTKDITTNRED